jgi:purine-binding chemotaxis protein CheW
MAEPADPSASHVRAATPGERRHVLLVRARSWTCALPIRDVVETMRALPIRPVAGAPPFVRGLAMIRGALLPVVNLGALLGDAGDQIGRRFVTVRTGDGRLVAIEVNEVLGARHIDVAALDAMPPLLEEAMPDLVERLGALDGQILAVLRAAALVSDSIWSELTSKGAR